METNLTRNQEVVGSILGLAQWVKDLALLWLWCRPAATALIGPLAWEPPYAPPRVRVRVRFLREQGHEIDLSDQLLSGGYSSHSQGSVTAPVLILWTCRMNLFLGGSSSCA